MIYHNVCPRNCYDTCGILSHVQNGRLVKVEGDPHHGYTQGKLCAKGYAYTEYVYSPQRLRYPLRQVPRGSGNWQRISWEEALQVIADKIIELHRRYGSSLACAYNKFSGNLGILHYATEGMFRGFGSHTKLHGNSCLAAGSDAFIYNHGQLKIKDPEDMAEAKKIVLWGVNPARTAINQWKFINQARDKGAKLLVIDPLYTDAAVQSDVYLQIRPGTDGLLAMAVLTILLEEGQLNSEYIQKHISGWEAFQSYLQEKVTLEKASQVTGIPLEGIHELADYYKQKPCATWAGFGLQRYSNGGQTMRCIDALVALSGNSLKGGGLYYNNTLGIFKENIINFPRPKSQEPIIERGIDINRFAQEALALSDPPLKFLWIASRNPLSQDQDRQDWRKLLQELELVVTVDLFMNETAAESDIVLPAASLFEEYDLNLSYWHQWIAINQKAILPFYEAKSDLEIARSLTKVLNHLHPNFSSFPDQLTALDWIARELTPEILERLGISDWQELLKGPRKLRMTDVNGYEQIFPTGTGKFQLYSFQAKENQLPALARFLEQREAKNPLYPLRLLTPQSLLRIHSQYRNVSWLNQNQQAEVVEMNPGDAKQRNLGEGENVSVFNEWGMCQRKLRLNRRVPQGVVVIAQSGRDSINQLLARQSADMGTLYSSSRGAAYYDAWAEVGKSMN
ncbi:molybdopterin-dependent oxidoreductase [Desulfitobacterium sp.]|uniref:molybdopterin-dependent oxidoreductase n=1 Tax=Desulfitobacterium sp. TaxID=49981 RepID=UPI002B1EB683|nr:molybdopterin-dependent oxidoreductase [Desulfitobacterium sp.]MEA4900971.1 molybdopterin-dependent oxidoreductase [Desulfitobacterium sp.]